MRTLPLPALLLAFLLACPAQAQPHVRPTMIGLDAAGVERLFGPPVAARDTSLSGWGRVRIVTYRHAGAMQAVRGSLGGRVAFPTVAVFVFRRGRADAAFSVEPYGNRRLQPLGTEARYVAQRRTEPLCQSALAHDFTLRSDDISPCLSMRTRTSRGEVSGSLTTHSVPSGHAVPLMAVWRADATESQRDAWRQLRFGLTARYAAGI